MRFLDVVPQVHTLTGATNGEYMWWVADVFDSRPTLFTSATMASACAYYMEKLKAKLEEPRCIIECAAVYVDTHGGIMVFKTQSKVQTSNAKSCGKHIAKLMFEEHGERFQSTVHHMDEFDKFRISRFKTLNNCLEQFEHLDKECEQQLAVRVPVLTQVAAWGSCAAEVTEECIVFSSDVGSQARMLALQECTIEAISVGIWPTGGMVCSECKDEKRRAAWVSQLLAEEYNAPGLLQAVKVSVKLYRDGHLPHPKHKMSIFMSRCKTAVRMANPEAEVDLRKLPTKEQAAIQHAAQLGEDSVPQMLDPACRYCFIETLEEVREWAKMDDRSDHVANMFGCVAESCKRCGALRHHMPPAPKPTRGCLWDLHEALVHERRPFAKRRFGDAFSPTDFEE